MRNLVVPLDWTILKGWHASFPQRFDDLPRKSRCFVTWKRGWTSTRLSNSCDQTRIGTFPDSKCVNSAFFSLWPSILDHLLGVVDLPIGQKENSFPSVRKQLLAGCPKWLKDFCASKVSIHFGNVLLCVFHWFITIGNQFVIFDGKEFILWTKWADSELGSRWEGLNEQL